MVKVCAMLVSMRPKVSVKVAPVAAGVVRSVTLTGLDGTVEYTPPATRVAPVIAPPAPMEVTWSCVAMKELPPWTVSRSPTL